ncbi:geranylgeranylglyceryl/heptaprenylglyceryl phosphate synthase [Thermophagus sp. OGC60D27]|uniref:geranylgeranylglyceryl/heptaprenylglyceryl phosphate synthase n=1 Tax=Thermophagus sp. OGC60D27 TaxID=3458415 RepID=UPI004038223F
MKIHNYIKDHIRAHKKMLALLIDPDKCRGEKLIQQTQLINLYRPHLILVGGSLIRHSADETVKYLKNNTDIPVVLYPGHPIQLSYSADALLFLTMISGRNPELLIGAHVISAPIIKEKGLEAIPTGYLLIDGGIPTSVEYISQTRPIPSEKSDIAASTALAGEMLGLQLIYLDAGSGALNPVPPDMINKVKSTIQIPLMIGGGINNEEKLKTALSSGADIVVVGNVLETDPYLLQSLMAITRQS